MSTQKGVIGQRESTMDLASDVLDARVCRESAGYVRDSYFLFTNSLSALAVMRQVHGPGDEQPRAKSQRGHRDQREKGDPHPARCSGQRGEVFGGMRPVIELARSRAR